MKNQNLLQCKNVAKSFQRNGSRLDVLQDINLNVNKGEAVLIFGKSGRGKSVLLSLLSGLDSPTSGEIYFNGFKQSQSSPGKLTNLRRNDIGIIFQNLNLIPSWTALENVEASLQNIVDDPFARRKFAREFLENVGLKNRLNHLPSEMSMGEQQRTAIARTLIREPKLILADEPTGDLDNELALDIINILSSYMQENNSSLIITTHGHFASHSLRTDQSFILENGMLISN